MIYQRAVALSLYTVNSWHAHACLDCRRYFTWDQHLFPHPAQLQDELASHGRRMVTIIDPHIKRDSSYYIYQEAEKAGYFVKDKDGKDFDGHALPSSPVELLWKKAGWLPAAVPLVSHHMLSSRGPRQCDASADRAACRAWLCGCAGGAGRGPPPTWTC